VAEPGRAARVATVLLAALLSVGAAGCGVRDEPPGFEAVELSTGEPVSTDGLRGRPTLLAAFATWCAPCERELPALEEALPDIEAAGVDVIAVNVDGPGVGEDEVAAMIERLAPSLDVWRDSGSTMLVAYEAIFMPYSVLLDANGDVIASWSGSLDPTSDDFLAAIGDAI
jgi:thiol-disulfide isomerase/thioredoxin